MLDLSPTKILVVLVVALIVLGPDKLPVVAKQLGAGWGSLRKLRAKLEEEVRESFPDLPSTEHLARAVRSPLSFLDQLADAHEREQQDGPPTAAPVAPTPTFDAAGPEAGEEGEQVPPPLTGVNGRAGAGRTPSANANGKGNGNSTAAAATAGPDGAPAAPGRFAGGAPWEDGIARHLAELTDDPSLN